MFFISFVVSKLDNTYILFKTNQYSKCLIQNDNLYDKDDYLNMLFSTVQVQKSFYNKSERGTSKIFDHQDNYVTNVVETIYDNTVTMDLTSKFFIFYFCLIIKCINNNYDLRYFR